VVSPDEGSTSGDPAPEAPMYVLCDPCNAYVPYDQATGRPRGTLANGVLRRQRQHVFECYTQIRRRKHCNHQRVQEMMAALLHLSPKGGYIRNMDSATCEKAIRVCRFVLGDKEQE
jgi:hypothetical protein